MKVRLPNLRLATVDASGIPAAGDDGPGIGLGILDDGSAAVKLRNPWLLPIPPFAPCAVFDSEQDGLTYVVAVEASAVAPEDSNPSAQVGRLLAAS